jgi:hypothetical protein
MTVKLRYELTGSGWAECSLEIDGVEATVTASYLSDALDELCRAIVSVLAGDPEATASFGEEPGEYRWRFERVGGDRVRVRILEFPELWGQAPESAGKVIFDAECRLRTLAGALLSELQRLEQTYGAAGYRERWIEHPFPAQRIVQLSELLRGATR